MALALRLVRNEIIIIIMHALCFCHMCWQVLAGAGRQSHFVLALHHVQDGHVVLSGWRLPIGQELL